ncbi:MAG: BlaI/MecI/CopY family transcriptional regulator [Vicingaceae bacterium]
MKNLSEKELELMNHLWELDSAYMKDLVSCYQDPKPAYTTISTMVNRLIQKGHIDFEQQGRDKKYFPKLKKPSYFSQEIRKMVNKYFNNSAAQFASFFTKESDLSLKQLEELQKMVDQQIEEKKSQS